MLRCFICITNVAGSVDWTLAIIRTSITTAFFSICLSLLLLHRYRYLVLDATKPKFGAHRAIFYDVTVQVANPIISTFVPRARPRNCINKPGRQCSRKRYCRHTYTYVQRTHAHKAPVSLTDLAYIASCCSCRMRRRGNNDREDGRRAQRRYSGHSGANIWKGWWRESSRTTRTQGRVILLRWVGCSSSIRSTSAALF